MHSTEIYKDPPPPLFVARVHSMSNQLKWKRIGPRKCKAPKPVNAPVLVKGPTDANRDCLQIFIILGQLELLRGEASFEGTK